MYCISLDLVRKASANRMPRGPGMAIYNPDGSPYGRAIQHNKRYTDIEEDHWEALVQHLQQTCNQHNQGDIEIVLAAHKKHGGHRPDFKTQVLFRGSHTQGLQNYNALLAELNVHI